MLILSSPVTFLPSGGFTHPCYRAGPTTHIFYPTSGPPVLRSSKSKAVELIVFPFLFSLEAGAQACGMQRSSVRDPKRRQRTRPQQRQCAPWEERRQPSSGRAWRRRWCAPLGSNGGWAPAAGGSLPRVEQLWMFFNLSFYAKVFSQNICKSFFILRKKFFTKHSAKVFSYYLAAKVSLSTFL